MTAESGKTVHAITLSRMNFSGYVGHTTKYNWMFTIACCWTVGLGLGLDLVSGWSVVMHPYLYNFSSFNRTRRNGLRY